MSLTYIQINGNNNQHIEGGDIQGVLPKIDRKKKKKIKSTCNGQEILTNLAINKMYLLKGVPQIKPNWKSKRIRSVC